MDILTLVVSMASICISFLLHMAYTTMQNEITELKIKMRSQELMLEERDVQMIERIEKALDLNTKVLDNAVDVNKLSRTVNENAHQLCETVKKQNKEVEELRSGCEKLLLLYSNSNKETNLTNEEEMEVSA